MRIFSGRLGSREAVCMWVCVGVRFCVCVWVCVPVCCFCHQFIVQFSYFSRFFSLFGFFLQCFLLVGLFVFPAICFIGHLFVCCSYKCSGICQSLVSEAQPSLLSPSLCPLLFIWTGCRRHSVIRSIVWSHVAAALLLWSALHWLQLFRMSGEVEKTCGKLARSGPELRILKREL